MKNLKKEPAKQEWKLSRNFDLSIVNSPLIRICTEEELKQSIRCAMALIGLRGSNRLLLTVNIQQEV